MPAPNSYIVMSTVSKQFLGELHGSLKNLKIQVMDIQGIDTSTPVHMTIAQGVGDKKDDQTITKIRQETLIKKLKEISQNNHSTFMLPTDMLITPPNSKTNKCLVLLTFNSITDIPGSGDTEQLDLKKLNRELINTTFKDPNINLKGDTRFEYLPHITIGELDLNINPNAKKELEDQKQTIISRLSQQVRPLNLYDLKLAYNQTTYISGSQELLNAPLARRDYSICEVMLENSGTIANNPNSNYIIKMTDENKAKEFVQFLCTMGIYKTGGKSKQILTLTDGTFSIRLSADEKAKINGMVEGISASQPNLKKAKPISLTTKSPANPSYSSAASSSTTTMPTALPTTPQKQDFSILSSDVSTTGKNVGSYIITFPDRKKAEKFVEFLATKGIYKQSAPGTLKTIIQQLNGQYTVMLNPQEQKFLLTTVKGINPNDNPPKHHTSTKKKP